MRHFSVVQGDINIASKKGKLFTKAEISVVTESAGKAACLVRHKHF